MVLRARTVTDGLALRHEFMKRLHRAYAQHGIEIPFPQRVLHMATGVRVEGNGAVAPVEQG